MAPGNDTPAVTLIGAGGVTHTFDLPLREVYADQVAAGQLRPATDDDAALLTDETTDETAKAADEPAGNASTDEWRDHAESIGLDVPEDAGRDDIRQLVADHNA